LKYRAVVLSCKLADPSGSYIRENESVSIHGQKGGRLGEFLGVILGGYFIIIIGIRIGLIDAFPPIGGLIYN
jgi:hypothetical protein